MVNINLQHTDLHHQSAEWPIIAIVGEEISTDVGNSNSGQATSPHIMAAFVQSPVASESFSKVRVESAFVPFVATAAKCNWSQVQLRVAILCSNHELALATCVLETHGLHGWGIVCRLEERESHPIKAEVSANIELLAIIEVHEAGVAQD